MEKQNYDSIILSMKVDDLIRIPAPDYIGYFWIDKDGNYTQNKDELVEKEEIRVPQTQYAETIGDYEYILEREAKNKNQTVADYLEILLEDLKEMLDQNVNDYKTLNVDLTDKRIRVKKFIKYLENRNSTNRLAQTFNTYIFTTEKGEQIFKSWHDMYKEKESLADYSFIFRMLVKDNFLQPHVGETVFREFLESFNIVIGKLKTLDKCTTNHKQSLYNKIKQT